MFRRRSLRRSTLLSLAVALAALAVAAPSASAGPCGRIVVNHDEWALSNEGFAGARAPNAQNFTRNLARWFAGGPSGQFLAYSNNGGLTQIDLENAMVASGYGWTVQKTGTLTLEQVKAYDGVFVGGGPGGAVADVLRDYVRGGGSVYVMGGTAGVGGGTAAGEAAHWNAFLNSFNLRLASTYNSFTGNLAISSSHPIFEGVGRLWQGRGQDVSEIDPTDPETDVLFSSGGHGLYAAFDECADDADQDGIEDPDDNCPQAANADQADFDGDGAGDACDADDDADGVADESDNCPTTQSSDTSDVDGDGRGAPCDEDDDGDSVADESDRCPVEAGAPPEGCPLPERKEQCKDGGWSAFGDTFRNQGDCVSFVATRGENQPAGES